MACEYSPVSSKDEITACYNSIKRIKEKLTDVQLSEYKQLLCGIGQYILEEEKVDIDNLYFLEVNKLLNRLAAKAQILGWPPLTEIDEMVGIANDLAERIKLSMKKKTTKGTTFASDANKLARKLTTVGDQ